MEGSPRAGTARSRAGACALLDGGGPRGSGGHGLRGAACARLRARSLRWSGRHATRRRLGLDGRRQCRSAGGPSWARLDARARREREYRGGYARPACPCGGQAKRRLAVCAGCPPADRESPADGSRLAARRRPTVHCGKESLRLSLSARSAETRQWLRLIVTVRLLPGPAVRRGHAIMAGLSQP